MVGLSSENYIPIGGEFMRLKRLLVPALAALLAFGLAGCGNSTSNQSGSNNTPKEIKIGATAGPHAQVAEAVAKEAAKQGITIKVVEFSDYITPNKALNEGDLQLNAYQHKPFMQNFNKQNNGHLVALTNTLWMPMGIYSHSVKDLKNLPNGATVAIPNDPTNGGRALALLAKAGLISLKEGMGFKATLQDIVGNPRNLQIRELEAAQLPRSLDDVVLSVIPMNYVQSAGLNVQDLGLFFEDKDEPLAVMVLAVREQDKDNETYKKIAEIYHSEAIKNFINETFKGSIKPADADKDQK